METINYNYVGLSGYIQPIYLPVSDTNKNITFVSKHYLDANYIGNPIVYNLYDEDNIQFGKIYINFPNLYADNGIANDNRNKIFYKIQINNKSVVSGFIKDDIGSSTDYQWQENKTVVFSFCDPDVQISSDYDYLSKQRDISTDTNTYILFENEYNSHYTINTPLSNSSTALTAETIWSDYQLITHEQIEGNTNYTVNLITETENEWPEDETNKYWQDNSNSNAMYQQKFVNQSGRQNIANYYFQFEIATDDYLDPTKYKLKCFKTNLQGG